MISLGCECLATLLSFARQMNQGRPMGGRYLGDIGWPVGSFPGQASLVPLLGQVRRPHAQVDVASMLLWLGIAAVTIAVASVGAYLAHRAAQRRRFNSHPGLFDALCKLHQLNRAQRALLQQVVHVRKTACPGQIFTDPTWLTCKTLPAALQSKSADLEKLHRTLFG